jgi:hypothetical protein
MSLSNPSGDSLTYYYVRDDGGGSGHLTVGGVAQADGPWWVRATSNWSNIQYVGGSSGGTDRLEVLAWDATTNSWVSSGLEWRA